MFTKGKLVLGLASVISCILMNQSNMRCSVADQSFINVKRTSEKYQQEQRGLLLKELSRLERADPISDFRLSLKKKDLSFIGYKGFTVEVPGIVDGQRNSYVLKYGIKIIKGTSDVTRREDMERLKKVVRRYVIPYNKLLLKYLQGRKKSSK